MKKHIALLHLIFAFFSCQPDEEYKISGYTQKIIVEGSIANDEFPSVYLSFNVPLSEKVDSDSIRNYVISVAKVMISDSEDPNAAGAKTEILTAGYWNETRFPFHEYKGTDFRGESGKTYYLTVDYGGYTMHAKTTIPDKTGITGFKTNSVNDSMSILSLTMNIDPAKKQSYRVFTKKSKDGYYVPTPFLFNSTFSLSGVQEFTLRPSPKLNDPSYKEGIYFRKGDQVNIMFCTIDSTSTQFFKELTMLSSSTGIGNEIFMGEKEALKSNISYPGFGIWFGNGVNYYTYIIP